MSFAEGVPTAQITLGGRSYTVGYTWGVKQRIRDHFKAKGVDPKDANQEESLAAAIWAGIDDPATRNALSVEAIADMIHPGNEEQIGLVLYELATRSEPEPDPNAKPAAVRKTEEPTAGRSTSISSSQLVSMT